MKVIGIVEIEGVSDVFAMSTDSPRKKQTSYKCISQRSLLCFDPSPLFN